MQRLPLELVEELLLYLPGYKVLFSYLDPRFPLPEIGEKYGHKVERLCLAGNLQHALYVIERGSVDLSRVHRALYDSGDPECMEYAESRCPNVKKSVSAAASVSEYLASRDLAPPKIETAMRVNNFELVKQLFSRIASYEVFYTFCYALKLRRWHMAEYIVEHHRNRIQLSNDFDRYANPKAKCASRILDIVLKFTTLKEIGKCTTNSHLLLEACRRGCEFEHDVLHRITRSVEYVEVARQLISVGIRFEECCFDRYHGKHSLEFVRAIASLQLNYLELLLPYIFNMEIIGDEKLCVWLFEESGISTREAVDIFISSFRENSDDLLSLLPLTDDDLDYIWQKEYTESFLYLYRSLPESRRRSYASKWDTMKLLDFLALTRLTNYCH